MSLHRFLLIAGEEGGQWCEAAQKASASTGVGVDSVRIGHIDGDLFDPRVTWTKYRGISPQGAVLIRPDRFVAWRSAGAAPDVPTATTQLTAALRSILGLKEALRSAL